MPALLSLQSRPDVSESARSAFRQLVYTPYVVCGEALLISYVAKQKLSLKRLLAQIGWTQLETGSQLAVI